MGFKKWFYSHISTPNNSIPNSGKVRKCAKCGNWYFFYKEDKGTLKEKYCSKCVKEMK